MCVDWCRYRTLFAGQGKKALSEPAVISIAEEHGKSAAQILGRWCVQKGLIYLPKSEKEERMIENSQVRGIHTVRCKHLISGSFSSSDWGTDRCSTLSSLMRTSRRWMG